MLPEFLLHTKKRLKKQAGMLRERLSGNTTQPSHQTESKIQEDNHVKLLGRESLPTNPLYEQFGAVSFHWQQPNQELITFVQEHYRETMDTEYLPLYVAELYGSKEDIMRAYRIFEEICKTDQKINPTLVEDRKVLIETPALEKTSPTNYNDDTTITHTLPIMRRDGSYTPPVIRNNEIRTYHRLGVMLLNLTPSHAQLVVIKHKAAFDNPHLQFLVNNIREEARTKLQNMQYAA